MGPAEDAPGRVLDRDAWRCQLRFAGVRTVLADCVQHTEGPRRDRRRPGPWMVASCTPCNQHIGEPHRGTADPEHTPHCWWAEEVQ